MCYTLPWAWLKLPVEYWLTAQPMQIHSKYAQVHVVQVECIYSDTLPHICIQAYARILGYTQRSYLCWDDGWAFVPPVQTRRWSTCVRARACVPRVCVVSLCAYVCMFMCLSLSLWVSCVASQSLAVYIIAYTVFDPHAGDAFHHLHPDARQRTSSPTERR